MNSFGKLNAAIYRNMQIILNDNLKSIDIKSGQYDFFYVISKQEGITQKDLSEHLMIGKATTAKAVKDLVDNGYVYKKENKDDRRLEHIYLTEKGKKIVPEIYKIFKANVDMATYGISDDHVEILISALEKVLSNLLDEKERLDN